jgi:hypothetical protein
MGVALGTVMIRCPKTGRAIPTGIEVDRAGFQSATVFFSRTFCPRCQTYHEWFAKDAWLSELATYRRASARSRQPAISVERGLDSPKNIARLNIEHYRRRLADETDPTKLATIERLLAEEKRKLRDFEGGGRQRQHD